MVKRTFSFAKKYLIMSFIIVIAIANLAFADNEKITTFVDNISKNVINIISNKNTDDAKKEQLLKDTFNENVDVEWIAKFVLGSYWRDASNEQKKRYVNLYRQYLQNSYVPKFKNYTNQKIEINKVSKEDKDEYLVSTTIKSQDNFVKVDYRIRDIGNQKYFIFDVVAEGISLIISQRSDFASILSNGGIEELNKRLESKVSKSSK